MVLVGKINTGIVSLIAKSGARGIGVSGNDGDLIIARKMGLQKVTVAGKEHEVDLGHVGEIEVVDPSLLNTLLDNNYIPVIAPIAIDRNGQNLNINADTAAGDLAVALKAHKLINMTDVDGVMNRERTTVYRRLALDEAKEMMAQGVISEGMIPKVTSLIDAVERGVRFAHIVNGNIRHNLLLELFTDEGIGTMVTEKKVPYGDKRIKGKQR